MKKKHFTGGFDLLKNVRRSDRHQRLNDTIFLEIDQVVDPRIELWVLVWITSQLQRFLQPLLIFEMSETSIYHTL